MTLEKAIQLIDADGDSRQRTLLDLYNYERFPPEFIKSVENQIVKEGEDILYNMKMKVIYKYDN